MTLTAQALIAAARDFDDHNGRHLEIVLERDHAQAILTLAAELANDLAALRIALPYLPANDDGAPIAERVRALSEALGS